MNLVSNFIFKYNVHPHRVHSASCVLPAPPLHGVLINTDSQNTNQIEGPVITFQCDPGFSLGAVTATCNNSCLWDPDPALAYNYAVCAYWHNNYRCDYFYWEHCSYSWRCCWRSACGGTDCSGTHTSLSDYHQEKKKWQVVNRRLFAIVNILHLSFNMQIANFQAMNFQQPQLVQYTRKLV